MTEKSTPVPPPEAVAAAYFRCWQARDFDALRSVLADDVTFRGPLGEADGAQECLRGLRGMAQILDEIVVRHVFVDGNDVLTWFDLHTRVAPPAPAANWSHVENGRITQIGVAFDARALAAALGR
jgi:ketosteroid isomerase-like protein